MCPILTCQSLEFDFREKISNLKTYYCELDLGSYFASLRQIRDLTIILETWKKFLVICFTVGWFQDMSSLFLSCRVPKLLILAGMILYLSLSTNTARFFYYFYSQVVFIQFNSMYSYNLYPWLAKAIGNFSLKTPCLVWRVCLFLILLHYSGICIISCKNFFSSLFQRLCELFLL